MCACVRWPAWLLTACAETITKHGHQFQDNDLQQVGTGMSQDQVQHHARHAHHDGHGRHRERLLLYFQHAGADRRSSSRSRRTARCWRCISRRSGSVDRVAQYGLKDGKVFDYVKQQTPTAARDEGMLKALFRNLGTKQLGLE